jgi:chloride channel protein, CIC family
VLVLHKLLEQFTTPDAWFPENLRGRNRRLLALVVALGVVSGLLAKLMDLAVEHAYRGVLLRVLDTQHLDVQLHLDWRLVGLPVVAGLVCGIFLHRSKVPSGPHGTDVLIHAFHRNGGRISLGKAILGAALAVVVIAFGASVGKEAPIAVLSAAMGAWVADRAKLSHRERRILLLAGCAAGIGAIFQCPLGAALFAISIVYQGLEMESDALIPAVIASVVGYATYMSVGGFGDRLLDGTATLAFRHPLELFPYTGLAGLCAVGAWGFKASLDRIEGWVQSTTIYPWAITAVAGLGVGLLAMVMPHITDSRFEFVQTLLDGVDATTRAQWLGVAALCMVIVVGKVIATTAMMGTHCAGGMFGPILMVGGVLGAAWGALLTALVPGEFPPELRAALIPVGIAGSLAASLRTPLAAVVMVTEMTGSFGLIVPLMLTASVAYLLGQRWGIYPDQLHDLHESPAHAGDPVVRRLETWCAADLMNTDKSLTIGPATPLSDLVGRIKSGTYPYFSVVKNKRLLGMISASDVVRAHELVGSMPMIIADDVMNNAPHVVRHDDDLYSLMDQYRQKKCNVFPVVDDHGDYLGTLRLGYIREQLTQWLQKQHNAVAAEDPVVAHASDHTDIDALLSNLPTPHQRRVQHLPVGEDLAGHTLVDLKFRRQVGEVIALTDQAGNPVSPVPPERVLAEGETLLYIPNPTRSAHSPDQGE